MEPETCKTCGTDLFYAESEINFYDEVNDEKLEVILGAYWCSTCGYHRVVRV